MRSVWWGLIALGGVMMGCSHPPQFADPIQAIEEHPRITYQSLVPEEPVVERCPTGVPTALPAQAAVETEKTEPVVPEPPATNLSDEPIAKPFFVAFHKDEWHIPPDQEGWFDVLEHLDQNGHYLVVGYSHGEDEAEQALLAQRRAEYIGSLMHQAGFPLNQIHRMASWSQQREPFAPPAGAQIFLLGEGATELRLGVAETGAPAS